MKAFLNVIWVIACIAFAGYAFYDHFFGEKASKEDLSGKEVAKEVKEKHIRTYLNNFYGSVTVDDVVLVKDKNKEKTYSGKVTFRRNGNTYTRPIKVTYKMHDYNTEYFYGFDFRRYREDQDILVEDADALIRNLISKNQTRFVAEGISDFQLINAKFISPGVVRCTLKVKYYQALFKGVNYSASALDTDTISVSVSGSDSESESDSDNSKPDIIKADLHINLTANDDGITYELKEIKE